MREPQQGVKLKFAASGPLRCSDCLPRSAAAPALFTVGLDGFGSGVHGYLRFSLHNFRTPTIPDVGTGYLKVEGILDTLATGP